MVSEKNNTLNQTAWFFLNTRRSSFILCVGSSRWRSPRRCHVFVILISSFSPVSLSPTPPSTLLPCCAAAKLPCSPSRRPKKEKKKRSYFNMCFNKEKTGWRKWGQTSWRTSAQHPNIQHPSFSNAADAEQEQPYICANEQSMKPHTHTRPSLQYLAGSPLTASGTVWG